ncbi:hypothetical protein D030_0755B, partial [Vibrio parahaemolyticus AQ3810]
SAHLYHIACREKQLDKRRIEVRFKLNITMK